MTESRLAVLHHKVSDKVSWFPIFGLHHVVLHGRPAMTQLARGGKELQQRQGILLALDSMIQLAWPWIRP